MNELNESKPPFLRELKKDSAFDDLHHYLDVNFRLLKEDFTSELREGLHAYQVDPKQRNSQVNVYSTAKISGFFATKFFFGLRLCIYVKNKHMQFQRKLMQGGMVIFSDDDFQKRII